MGRPKKKIRRENFNTTIEKELLELIRNISEETDIPINRLIENALRDKYVQSDKHESDE